MVNWKWCTCTFYGRPLIVIKPHSKFHTIIYLITICFIPGYENVFGVRFKSDASI